MYGPTALSAISAAQANPPITTKGRYAARLALDDQTRSMVYRLRYAAYRTQGHIPHADDGRFEDEYDSLPNATSIVILEGDKPVASVRVCTLSLDPSLQSPARSQYPQIINKLLSSYQPSGFGQRGVEVNRMVRSPEYDNSQGLVFLCYRMAGYIAMTTHSQFIFACVRSHHAHFYKRLGYQSASGPGPYPGLSCEMELLYCTRERFDQIRKAYPIIDPLTANTGACDGFLEGATVPLSIA